MLEKQEIVDKIEIVGPHRHVQVRKATVILENGNELSRSFKRHVIAPGDDSSKEDITVRTICNAIHTQDIVDNFTKNIKTKDYV